MGKSHDEGFRRVEKGFGEARVALSWVLKVMRFIDERSSLWTD